MTENSDEYADDTVLPIKFVNRCCIISHEAPDLLVMLMEYWHSIQDEDAGKTSAINFVISVHAAEILGVTLIDSAKKRRAKPKTKN